MTTKCVRVSVAVLCAVGLVVLGLPVRAAGTEDPAAVEGSASLDPLTRATLEMLAIELGAGRTVPDVEMTYLRDANSRVYSTETSGVWRTVVAEDPVHYLTPEGWEPIDEGLHATGGGGFENGSNSFDVTIGEDPSTSMLGFSVPGVGSVTYGLSGAATVPPTQTGDSAVVYDAVLAGVSVLLQSRATSVKETLVLEASDAPDTFTFGLGLDALTARVAASGAVEFADGNGTVVAHVPSGWMVDSSVDPETGLPSFSDGVTYEVTSGVSGAELVVRLDREWLDAPERVYPVFVDPTTTLGPVASGMYDDTYQAALGKSWHGDDVSLKVGEAFINHRSFLRFDVSGLSPVTTRTLDTDLTFTLEAGDGCVGSEPVNVRPITNAWPDPDSDEKWMEDDDWSWSAPTGSNVGSAISVSESCPGGTSDFVIEGSGLDDLVDDWIDGGTANHGIGLYANTEGASGQYK